MLRPEYIQCKNVALLFSKFVQTSSRCFLVIYTKVSQVKYYTFLIYPTTPHTHTYLRLPDRQTDILLTEKKSHYRLICHRNERDICTCIYKIVSLLKSYDNIHGMTYTAKIMLSGIAKIKTGYFDNINDYY